MMVAGEPMCAIAALPKQSVDVMAVETSKILRLTRTTVEPISFVLPRADHLKSYFNDDIFVPACSRARSQKTDAWLRGDNVLPPREDLQPAGSTRLSDKPPEEVKISKAQITRQKIAEMKADENKDADNFSRLQAMAVQRSKYQAPGSKGGRAGVDCAAVVQDDTDSDDGWSD
eukprot:FR744190.1.p1 GENE.FR744190.1~~FR744190.1.p1  ORF type:complete len:191 (+),score=18.46 FR744190.1:56-574(+)